MHPVFAHTYSHTHAYSYLHINRDLYILTKWNRKNNIATTETNKKIQKMAGERVANETVTLTTIKWDDVLPY